METPLISVIVPIYNVEKYLRKCIESILNQTYTNLEIILVDDGSTDSSREICEAYAAKDFRITIVQKENGGLASARNKGLENAHGEYISFIDSDDWIESDTYEIMCRAALTHSGRIVVCGRYNVNEQTGEKSAMFDLDGEHVWTRTEAIRHYLTWNNMDTSVCDKLFPANLIMDLKFPSGFVSEDVLFTYPSLERSAGVVHIGVCKYNYLQRSGSITHSNFSTRSRGLIVYPRVVWESVYRNFGELKKEADYYRFSRAIIYINLLYSNGGKEREESKELRKKLLSILTNKCFSTRQKIMAISMAFHFWGVMLKLYHMLKKGGRR